MLPLPQFGIGLPLGIMFSSLISEDAATAAAALLTASGRLDLRVGLAAAFLGIWLGDLLLFAGARLAGNAVVRHDLFPRFRDYTLVRTVHTWFSHHGALALVLTRLVPGTRFITYVTAGASDMNFAIFAAVTGLCAAVWVAAIFAVAHQVGVGARLFAISGPVQIAITIGLLLLAAMGLRRAGPWISRQLIRYRRWEFWPAWLFYPPVVLMCAWLGIKYRGFALPALANPAQRNGGIIGESKIDILDALVQHAPERVARAFLIPAARPSERAEFLRWIVERHELQLPLVLKPDTAQRGAGFHKLLALDDAAPYFEQVMTPVVTQEYVPGPYEAGIFYYRFPGSGRGAIFSITDKEFPSVVGDGVSTLEELVLADARAAIIAPTYLERFATLRTTVVPAGQSVRLVEAGNHCQGCIFRNGAHLMSPQLEEAIDSIARTLPGFFIGRFDVRYTSPAALKEGRGFQIIELNGAASEATDIYDPAMRLADAYRTLFRQWELVYAIGAENRRRGARAPSLIAVILDWLQYRRDSALYPAAD